MLKVRVNSKKTNKKIYVPVPYALFNVAISIATSKFVRRKIQESINKKKAINNEIIEDSFQFPELDKEQLKLVVKELKKYRGLEIVHVIDKDGEEVVITL